MKGLNSGGTFLQNQSDIHVMVCIFFVVMQSGRLLFSAHDSSVKKVHFVSNFILSQYVDNADPLDFFLFFNII